MHSVRDFILFVLVFLSAPSLFAAGAVGGVVQGHVIYDEDTARPWKFGRYYIKDRKKGLLAECVVALDGSNLTSTRTNRTVIVDQQGFQFVPETTAIAAGDSVKFNNSDDSVHNIMSNDGGKPFNVNMGKGDTHVQQFNQPGGLEKPVRIGCIYHGGMRAWIYVFDHSWFTVTPADGHFRFENVPPGTYTLGIAHPAGRLAWSQEIQVSPDADLKLEIHLTADHISKPKR